MLQAIKVQHSTLGSVPSRAIASRFSFAKEAARSYLPFNGYLRSDIDATYEELRSRGARIVEPLEKKPWGLRKFTVEDIDGNRFYFHGD